jgi:ribosomal protein L7Ae-like RNA K-turn-binding protein
MSITEKKQFLLQIVEDADEKLTGLLLALANEYNSIPYGENYSMEEISDFNKTRDEYLQNPAIVFTVEEAHQKIRNKLRDAI